MFTSHYCLATCTHCKPYRQGNREYEFIADRHGSLCYQICTLDELKTCTLKFHNLKSIYVICSG